MNAAIAAVEVAAIRWFYDDIHFDAMLYGSVFRSMCMCCSIALCDTGNGFQKLPSKRSNPLLSAQRIDANPCVCAPVWLWGRCLSPAFQLSDRVASIRVKGINPQSPNLQGIQYILVGPMPFKLDILKSPQRGIRMQIWRLEFYHNVSDAMAGRIARNC
jgi:hypothetical protein